VTARPARAEPDQCSGLLDEEPYAGYAVVHLGDAGTVGEEVLILFATPAAAEAAARRHGIREFAIRPVHFSPPPLVGKHEGEITGAPRMANLPHLRAGNPYQPG
jgi:hypothetical protein